MPYLDVGKSRIYYESHGEGLPLVFAHGVGGNHASWFQQVAALSDRFRVIVFDHRGFGNSTDVEQSGRTAFADDLAALLAALNATQPVLIGQSMGGGTCLALTCRFPSRVRALVLADSLVGMVLPEDLRTLMQTTEMANANLSQSERVLGATTRRERPTLSVLYAQIASFNAITLQTLQGCGNLHSAQELAATGVPTLFVSGEEDILFPPAIIRQVQRQVPGSRFIGLPGAGHSAHFEMPEPFNTAIVGWLTEMGLCGHCGRAAS